MICSSKTQKVENIKTFEKKNDNKFEFIIIVFSTIISIESFFDLVILYLLQSNQTKCLSTFYKLTISRLYIYILN